MTRAKILFPGWRYGPKGEGPELFQTEDDVPKGWTRTPPERAARDAFDHDGDGNPGGSKPQDPPALSGMTRAELEAQAAKEGVDLEAIEGTGASGNVRNDDIKAAIEAKRGE